MRCRAAVGSDALTRLPGKADLTLALRLSLAEAVFELMSENRGTGVAQIVPELGFASAA